MKKLFLLFAPLVLFGCSSKLPNELDYNKMPMGEFTFVKFTGENGKAMYSLSIDDEKLKEKYPELKNFDIEPIEVTPEPQKWKNGDKVHLKFEIQVCTEDDKDCAEIPYEYSSVEVSGLNKNAAEIKAEEQQKKEVESKRKAEEKKKKEAEIKAYDNPLPYKKIARDPDKYINKKYTFTGKIAQVQKLTDGEMLRVYVDGDYDKLVLVLIPTNKKGTNLLEDDYVKFRVDTNGAYTYTTVLGAEITAPLFSVYSYKLQ